MKQLWNVKTNKGDICGCDWKMAVYPQTYGNLIEETEDTLIWT